MNKVDALVKQIAGAVEFEKNQAELEKARKIQAEMELAKKLKQDEETRKREEEEVKKQ
jgi:hypothetical protein